MAGTISGANFPNNANVNAANMRNNPNWDPNKIFIPGYEEANNPSRHQDSVTISPEARGENKGENMREGKGNQKTDDSVIDWKKIKKFFSF